MAERKNPPQDASNELQAPKRLRSVPGAQVKPAEPRVASGSGEAAGPRGEAGARADEKARTGLGAGSRPASEPGSGSPAASVSAAGSGANANDKAGSPNRSRVAAQAAEDAEDKPVPSRAARKRAAADAPSRVAASENPQTQDSRGEAQPQTGSTKKARRRVPRWRIVVALVGVVLVAAVASFGLFSWNRWMRYDDAADIQGQWYAAGTSVPVSIDEHAIWFDEKTSYEYSLDPEKKVVSYRLGNLEGGGHYRFCGERQYLVIADGSGFTKWGTALDDLQHDASELFGSLVGGSLQLHEGEGTIVLSRIPDSSVVNVESQPAASQEEASSAAGENPEAADASDGAKSAAEDGSSGPSAEAPESGASGSAGTTKDVFAQVQDDAYEASSSSASSRPSGQDAGEADSTGQEGQAGQAQR